MLGFLITLLIAIPASAFLGLLLGRRLWACAIKEGKPPLLFSKSFSKFYFGNIAQAVLDARRHRHENDGFRKENRHFSTLLNLVPFPAWRRDEFGNVIYCNLAYSALLENVPERILEEYGLELSQNSQKLAETARQKNLPMSEYFHVIVEGERKLYQLCEIPDPDLEGTVGFALDCSNRERVEEELRRHIAAHAELMEASNMAIAIYDGDKKLSFFNNAYVALWKFDRQWLNTKPDFIEVIEYLREKRRLPELVNFQLFKQQRAKLFHDLLEPHEEILHLPDGKIVRMVILPYTLGGLIFFYEDVTDRLALEGSYNTLIAVQRETLNNLHEGVAVYGEDGRLRLSNPVYQKLWGLSPDFLLSEPHIDEILEMTKHYYHFTDWTDFKARMITQLHARKMNYQRVERKDGTVVDYSTVPLPDGATLITFLDVTDTTLVERSLIDKNEALREADRLKTEFLFSVSYELRSPLTSITGFSEILKEKYFGELNDRQNEYVTAIYDSSVQLGNLINNILDLATIEAGYMRLEVHKFPVKKIIEDIDKETKNLQEMNDRHIEFTCHEALGTLEADENRVKQILLNLIHNAIKFTPQDGRIMVGAGMGENSDEVMLWVEDTGVGIPQHEQSSAFERFRAGALRNPRAGAGLGLAMVKNFVELHGGRIELESEVGKGTKIMCYLPRSHTPLFIADNKNSNTVFS